MGSVIENCRHFLEEKPSNSCLFLFLSSKLRNRKARLYLGIFLIYFVAGFAFLAIGLQPVKSAEAVYAAEAGSAEESLAIPAISLSTPVKISTLSGSDLSVPEQIAASFTMHDNKYFIFGHSSSVFKDLKNLQIGDQIIYQGQSYTTALIEEKLKADVNMEDILAAADTPTIVLMTCSGEKIEDTNGDHTHRIIITAKLTTRELQDD